MRNGWQPFALGQLLTSAQQWVQIDDDTDYRQVTVRMRGGGVYLRGTTQGAKIGTKRQSIVKTGQFILSKIDARNGAFGLIPTDLDGAVVTGDFPVYEINQDRVLPDFLKLYVNTPGFIALCAAASMGTTNRQRLSPPTFLASKINLPLPWEQRRLVDIIASFDRTIEAAEKAERDHQIARTATLKERLRGHRNSTAQAGWDPAIVEDIADINPETAVNFAPNRIIQYVDLSSVSAAGGIDSAAIGTFRFGEAPGRARRVVRTGDVLISTVRPYLRGFAVVPGNLDGQVVSTGFTVLRAKKGVATPGFVWAVVTTDAFVDGLMRLATGTGYPAVRSGDVAIQPFLLPPPEERVRIADIIASFDLVAKTMRDLKHRTIQARLAVSDELLGGRHQWPALPDGALC